jgi:hypothetical protein
MNKAAVPPPLFSYNNLEYAFSNLPDVDVATDCVQAYKVTRKVTRQAALDCNVAGIVAVKCKSKAYVIRDGRVCAARFQEEFLIAYDRIQKRKRIHASRLHIGEDAQRR